MEEVDLTQIPSELLERELERRKEERRVERYERSCCRNCAHRIIGRSNFTTADVTAVCELYPKSKKTYSGRIPEYLQAYYACTDLIEVDCGDFLHRDSEEGVVLAEGRKKMSMRFDY